MSWTHVLWDPTPGGNVEHIEEHDLTTEDVDHVLQNPDASGISQSSGRPCVFGFTPGGRYVIVVYEEVDGQTVIPVTAYEIQEP
jgi:hypothetical protein